MREKWGEVSGVSVCDRPWRFLSVIFFVSRLLPVCLIFLLLLFALSILFVFSFPSLQK
jgi:hypothetical protein